MISELLVLVAVGMEAVSVCYRTLVLGHGNGRNRLDLQFKNRPGFIGDNSCNGRETQSQQRCQTGSPNNSQGKF